MNTAKNAYDKIMESYNTYQEELDKVTEDMNLEWSKTDYDRETVEWCINESSQIKSIMQGLQIALNITYREEKRYPLEVRK